MNDLDDDDELRAMLEARASRVPIDPVGVVAEGRRRALETPRATARRSGFRSAGAALSGVAAVAAVLLLVAVPLAFRPAASPSPSPSGPAAVAMDGAVTAAQLDLALQDPKSVAGLTVSVQGELVVDPAPCPTAESCRLQVAGLGTPHAVVLGLGDGRDPTPVPEFGPVAGVFALRITDQSIDGRVVLEELGPVAPATDRLAWAIPILAAGGELPTDLIAATGWIVQTPVHPCPSSEGQPCPATEDYLTAEAFQPAQIDGSVMRPPADTSLVLPGGSYDAWAPAPNVIAEGVEPRPVTLLLRLIKGVVCPTPTDPAASIDCYGLPNDTWQVAARLDVLPEVPTPTASPLPSATPVPQASADPASPPPSGRYPGGIPRAIDGEPVLIGLDSQARWREATDHTPFLVGGWFDSHNLSICSGGIGPQDPNPLAARGCPRYSVAGMPGRAIYPDSVTMPDGDGPIVLRVHTRDPGAATCFPEYVVQCRERTVVEAVLWFGDSTTAAAPIGPVRARSIATSVFVMEWRDQPGGSQTAVNEDIFTVPMACRPDAPWPTLLFSVHGDPRYGLIAVFPDTAARERFQAETDPLLGPKCLDLVIERPADPRWVGHDNVLVLLFADDALATRLADVLADPQREQKALPLTEPQFDRSLGTVTDYLVARATGELNRAWGERLVDPFQPEDEFDARYRGWLADTDRRATANALYGRLQAVEDPELTEARVGPAAWRVLQEPGVSGRIVGVAYDGATDPALATEEYLVIHMPESQFRDWQLIRIAGEPYPVVPTMITLGGSIHVPSASPGNDGSGDTPCYPVGQECGP